MPMTPAAPHIRAEELIASIISHIRAEELIASIISGAGILQEKSVPAALLPDLEDLDTALWDLLEASEELEREETR